METSGCGAAAPATRQRPASKWRELMGLRAREREVALQSFEGGQCTLSGEVESQDHNDDLMSLDWTENMRHECDRLFAADCGEQLQERGRRGGGEKARRSQRRSQRISSTNQMQSNRSQIISESQAANRSAPRASWSVQKQVNNNCAQLAQWLAELAKIPSSITQEQQQQQQQRTQAASYQTVGAWQNQADWQRPATDGDMSRVNEATLQPPPPNATTTTGTNTTGCVCCNWASLHPHERARQLYEERNCDNLSALSASSSLLSQLLNSSLNQLIEIDNGSSTCCVCDSGQPCGNTGPALAATTNDCNQNRDLTIHRRAQPLTSENHLPPLQLPMQQVVDERDLLVVTPMNGATSHRSHSAASPAAAALKVVKSSQDHSMRFTQERHERRPTKSRAQLDGAEHETTSQVMRAPARDGGQEQNGMTVRRSTLNCDQFSVKSQASSCSTLTAAVAGDFERLRQQILEVHKRRRASRKRDPLSAVARQIENSQHHLLASQGIGARKQVVDGRQQQFVTFDKDATSILQRRRQRQQQHQPEVSPERNFMNNQDGGGGGGGNSAADAACAADLLECCREICARTSSTTLTQDQVVEAPKVKCVADQAQERGTTRGESAKKRSMANGEPPLTEGELINCSLIMGNGQQQQHDSLLEVSKCSRAQSGQQPPQDHSSSASSSCLESSLSCLTNSELTLMQQKGSHLAPQEFLRNDKSPPPSSATADYAQVRRKASDKCLGQEGAPSLLDRRPFINHLNQRRPREREQIEQQVFSTSCDERHSNTTTSNLQSGGSISGSGGQSRGSPASSTSISSSVVSLGDSASSCAIRVTNTSGGDSSEDCSCGGATSNLKQVVQQQQQQQQATSGQANQEAASRNNRVASPLERELERDNERRPVSRQRALPADCTEPNCKQEMGLIGSRQQKQQQDHKQCDLVIESKGGSRQQLKQYKRQAAHERRRRIDLICSSENDLPAAAAAAAIGNLDLSYELDASELCAWESKFAVHPSSSSAAAAASGSPSCAQIDASKRGAILSHQKQCNRHAATTNHYITKHHQLTQAAQLYARNFVALPLHNQAVERPDKQHANGDEQSSRSLTAAGVIFSLDPSQEAADRASMVEATAQMVRVITSRDSSRPSSRTSSGMAPAAHSTFTRRTNSPRPHNVIDATTLEPIYDVPSLSLIDANPEQRCLSPDQRYPKVGVAGYQANPIQGEQTQLDRKRSLKMGPNVKSELTSLGKRETHSEQQAAIIEREHNQRDVEERNSHAKSLRHGEQILFHQRQTSEANKSSHSRVKKVQEAKDDCDYERELGMQMERDDVDDNKHKSSEGGHERRARGRHGMTTKTKKKVTCAQPSETITTTKNSTNLNAQLEQERQESATIRHTRPREQLGQSRRDKSRINNSVSAQQVDATSALIPCSTCWDLADDNDDNGTSTVCSSCSCSLSNADSACSSCCQSTLISSHSSSILYLLRNQTRHSRTFECSCDDESHSNDSDQSPSSLTQAYLRRHQHQHHHHHRHRPRRYRHGRARRQLVTSGLRSPRERQRRRRRHASSSAPLSIASGRLLRKKLRHMQRRRAHLAHSSRTDETGRRSSHGGHAGCARGEQAVARQAASANSYKVFGNDDERTGEQHAQQVRLRSLIRSEHATGAPTKSSRHPAELLEVLDEEEEELTEGGGGGGGSVGDQRQSQESEFVGGEQSCTNLKTFNDEQQPQQLPDDRGSLIIGQHTIRTRRRDQQQQWPLSELDNRENKRKPKRADVGRRQPPVNLLLSKNRALASRGGGGKINATTAGSPKARVGFGSPNDDLNQQHADGGVRVRRPRTRPTSSRSCRLCRPASELSCGSSCSHLRVVDRRHRPRRRRRKSHHGSSLASVVGAREELDRIRLLRRRQRKLIRRFLELGEEQEISPIDEATVAASSSAASKQLKIEYLSRQMGAVARELKSRRRSYKSRVRHFNQQQQQHRRKRARTPSGSSRFNKLLAATVAAAAGSSHDIIRANQSDRRAWTNEGYPAATERRRNLAATAASGLLRWRRLAQRRPISSTASCCRRRRCSLTSSSCVSGSLVTSLSRGAHLRTGVHHRHHRQLGRNRQRLGRNRDHYAERRHNGRVRPRRTTETHDDSALRAVERARPSDGNMTSMAVSGRAAATVGQLRDMQQALIASGHTTSGGRRITWKRSRHELNPSLTLVADQQQQHYDKREHRGRRTSSSSGRRARKLDGQTQRGNNNLTNYVDDSKFNMDKFLVRRPADQLARSRVATISSRRNSQPNSSVPFTWRQLDNHCQCKHCCLVGTLVRLDLEDAIRKRKTFNFHGGV